MTNAHKTKRIGAFLELLLHITDGDKFLYCIVTGDKTWVSCKTLETKCKSNGVASLIVSHETEERKAKFEHYEVILRVFWDQKGLIYVKFMQLGHYSEQEVCEMLLTEDFLFTTVCGPHASAQTR